MGSRQAVIPGMRICAAEDHYQAGEIRAYSRLSDSLHYYLFILPTLTGMGTYVLHGYIYASLVGHLRLVSNDKTAAAADKNDMVTVEVEPRGGSVVGSDLEAIGGRGSQSGALLVPEIGDVVTCRVLSVNPRFAKMQILCVRQTVLKDAFRYTSYTDGITKIPVFGTVLLLQVPTA